MKILCIITAFLLLGYAAVVSLSTRPKQKKDVFYIHDNTFTQDTARSWSHMTMADSFNVCCYGNRFVSDIPGKAHYIYDYIYPRGDSLLVGEIHTDSPFGIPSDQNFHLYKVDHINDSVYIKFKAMRPGD